MTDDHRTAPASDDDRLRADDLLLDALGQGAAAPPDDRFAVLLAAWRADLDEGRSASDLTTADAELIDAFCGGPVPAADAAAGAAPGHGPQPPGPAAPVRSPAPGTAPTVPPEPAPPGRERRGPARHRLGVRGPGQRGRNTTGPDQRGRARRVGRMRRLLIGVAAVVVGAAVLGLGANNAGPASPLWPVARLVYPEQAAVRAAEHEIDLARRSSTDRRYDQARAHLDRAEGYAAEVSDAAEARRLRDEIARIRAGLPPDGSKGSGTSGPSRPDPGDPTGPAAPAPSTPPGGPTRTPAPGDSATPTPQPTWPRLLPSPLLPSPLLPNLPLIPHLPLLPSLLPLI